MRKACWVISVLLLAGALLAGCGGGSGGEAKRGDKPVSEMHPGEKKYDPMQYKCPVDGEQDLKEEYYAEVDGQGRIYFDSEECMQKFKENPQQYLQDYQSVIEQMKRGRGSRGK